jgi:hypothetical protein
MGDYISISLLSPKVVSIVGLATVKFKLSKCTNAGRRRGWSRGLKGVEVSSLNFAARVSATACDNVDELEQQALKEELRMVAEERTGKSLTGGFSKLSLFKLQESYVH